MSKVLDWIHDKQWAITKPALETIIKIASREIEKGSIETALGRKIEPLDDSSRSEVRDGVAVIPVLGPIFPRANLFTEISGATSIEQLTKDFETAMDDDAVESIVLNIDSPGGEITGISEFAESVRVARERKPIKAFAYGMMASGAYWIGSAADEVIVADTALTGSIGVISTFIDTSKRDEMEGIKTIKIVSSISPLKAPDITTGAGRAKIQRIVDGLGEVFIAAIARNRDTKEETVKEDFGKGDVFTSVLAIDQGLADRMGSLDEVIDGLVANHSLSTTPLIGGQRMGGKASTPAAAAAAANVETTISAEGVRETSPGTYDEIHAAGAKAGADAAATAERERLQAIDAIDAPGFEHIVSENKYKPEMTAEKISSLILTAQGEKRKESAAAQDADAKALAEKSKGAGAAATDDIDMESANAAKVMAEGGNEYRDGSGQPTPQPSK